MSSAPQPIPSTCPRCNGSGWVPLSGDSLRVEPCTCQGDLRRRQRISASNIPRRYLTCRLRNFNDREALLETDLLVLDELGSQKPSNFVHDTLYYVINSRYNDVRTTIFTTNNVDDLADRIGDRLRSRLYEMASVVHLTGVDDYRRKKI